MDISYSLSFVQPVFSNNDNLIKLHHLNSVVCQQALGGELDTRATERRTTLKPAALLVGKLTVSFFSCLPVNLTVKPGCVSLCSFVHVINKALCNLCASMCSMNKAFILS